MLSLNQKLEEKTNPMKFIGSWDIEGKGFVNENNLQRVLNDMGYSMNQSDIKNFMGVVNPHNQGKLTNSELYGVISKAESNFKNLDMKVKTEIPAMLQNAYHQKMNKRESDNMYALLSNDIKNIRNRMLSKSENGFVKREEAESVLKDTLNKFGRQPNNPLIQKLVSKFQNSHGVAYCDIIEEIADFKTQERIKKERTRRDVVRRFNDNKGVFANKIDDTTVKINSEELELIEKKQNRVQKVFKSKFETDQDLINFLEKNSKGEKVQRLTKGDIFNKFEEINQRSLSMKDKQDIFQFCQNLKFRENEKTVSCNDLRDLING